jgi:S1-C subfamily serine protease
VQSGGSADAAGLRVGDVLLKIGDITMAPTPAVIEAIRTRFRGKAGQPLGFSVRRDGRPLTLTGEIKEQSRVGTTVARADTPGAKQDRVWRGLVTGTTGP